MSTSKNSAGVEDQMDAAGALDVILSQAEAEPVINTLEEHSEVESMEALLAERDKEICQLKGLIADQEMSTEEVDELDTLSGNIFPHTVLLKVFEHLDSESLLKCRLVCKSMKSVIDNSSKLMRRFSFTILGIHQFLDSTITTKVKNICFQRALKGSQEDLALFFGEVGESVETVTIDFLQRPHRCPVVRKPSHQNEADTVRRLLTNCKKLHTLKIASSNRAFLQYLDIKDDERFGNLHNFVLNIQGLMLEELAWLKPLVISFSALRSLKLYFETSLGFLGQPPARPSAQLSKIIFEHMFKYPRILKAVTANDTFISNVILLCAVMSGCPIDFGRTQFHLVQFLRLLQSVPERSITNGNYSSLKMGTLHLTSQTPLTDVDKQRIPKFTSLAVLQICFDTAEDDLRFLGQLPKLHILKLVSRCMISTPPLPAGIFSFGLPNVKIMELQGSVFKSAEVAYFAFHMWFPNLTVLQFTATHLPLDLMRFLSKMKNLKSLIFKNCSISDTTFLRPCESTKVGSNEKKLIVPAIVALKLVGLKLLNCPLLSDVCLCSGIQYCSTLKCLIFESTGIHINQFTNLGLRAILDAGCMRLQKDSRKDGVRSITFIGA